MTTTAQPSSAYGLTEEHEALRESVRAFASDAARRLQKMLGLRVLVEVVPPNSLPRTDFKARRVIDDRAAFRELYAEIRKGSA